MQNFIKASKSSSPTTILGATLLPTIGNNSMYIETSQSISLVKLFFLVLKKQVFFKLVLLITITT